MKYKTWKDSDMPIITHTNKRRLSPEQLFNLDLPLSSDQRDILIDYLTNELAEFISAFTYDENCIFFSIDGEWISVNKKGALDHLLN